jgi:hypothetical protein
MNAVALLPPLSSKVWPRLILIVASIVAIAVIVKTRVEIIRTREQAHTELERRIRDRSRADRIFASWTGLPVPMTADVFGGVPDAEVRETPPDPAIAPRTASRRDDSTRVEIEWTSARDVRALLDRRHDGRFGEDEFVNGTVAHFQTIAGAIPPAEQR